MAGDINGKQAQNWKKLQTPLGNASKASAINFVKSTNDPKLIPLIQAINEIVRGYSSDLHGTASDDKYRYIVDLILTRIKSFIRDDFTKKELVEIKDEIISAVDGISAGNLLKTLLASGLNELFDSDAKKEDIEELKSYLENLLNEKTTTDKTDTNTDVTKNNGITSQNNDNQISEIKKDQEAEDEEVDEYKDSTIAKNFSILHTMIQSQFNKLNENLKNLPGSNGFGKSFLNILSNFKKIINKSTKSLTGKLSNIGKKIGGISKSIVGGTISKMFGLVKKIGNSVSKIGAKFGRAFSSITGTLKGVCSAVKGFGKHVGNMMLSPFKKISGWFKSRKDKKTEAAAVKKEKLREKFMDFMMKIVDKIWVFVEPILNKLKIFMVAVMIPILFIAMKVLLIIAAITAIVVGIVLAVMWIKNKLIPKIKSLWKKFKGWASKKWVAFKKWLGDMWDGTKKVLKAIWDGFIYVISFKWLVDFGKWLWKQLVEFGKWIWRKLLEFGDWLYQKFLAPILNPIFDFYYQKIEPVIAPFIESLKNLVSRIKDIWKKFNWDENKSFFENLQCLASIMISAIKDWWKDSPFKTAYDNYIKPIIDSLSNLIARVKAIWANFKWDENKSFFENLKDASGAIVQGIKDWWNDENNPIRKIYTEHIKPMIEKIKTIISPIIEKIKDVWNDLKVKLAKVYIHIPVWDKDIYPFAALVDEPFLRNGNESANDAKKRIYKEQVEDKNKRIAEIQDKLNKGKLEGVKWVSGSDEERRQKMVDEMNRLKNEVKAAEQPSLAQQQVNNAMTPINSLNNMNNENNLALQKTGNEVSQKVAADNAATIAYREQQNAYGSEYLAKMNELDKKIDKYGKDPSVVTMPIPMQSQSNPAMMYKQKQYN